MERSVVEWRDEFREALVEVEAIRLAEDRDARRHNRHVGRMQQASLALRQTAEGRAVISAFIDDPVPTVALWAATQALSWDEREHVHGSRPSSSARAGMPSTPR